MGLEYKLRSLLKLNLKLFLDMHFLRESSFITVASGQQFYDGSDMSVLLPDAGADDTLFGTSNGQVWQSPFRQWVYEANVPLDGTNVSTPPVVASGLYIEGAFRPTDDPAFGHTIDFINGRIIFDSPQPLDLQVNAAYSAREVRVGFEHDFNQQFQRGFLESKYTTNPLTSMQIVYPSGQAQPFPAVFIEVNTRTMDAFELGNRSAIIKDTVILHVWALDDMQRDNIVDILTSQWRKPIPIINFNGSPLPLSGIYNTLSPEYIPYQNLLTNDRITTSFGSGVIPVQYIAYISDIKADNLNAAQEYERAIVTYDIEVYLNAPTAPLGNLFGPISRIPTIEDPLG
jgi:hypothetical protein